MNTTKLLINFWALMIMSELTQIQHETMWAIIFLITALVTFVFYLKGLFNE